MVRIRMLVTLASLAAMGLAVAGCGGKETAPGQPESVPRPETKVQVSTGDTAKIPESFPKDVPLYTGLTLQSVSALPSGGTFVVQGTTPDLLEKVDAALRAQAGDQGWTEAAPAGQPPGSDMVFLNFEKADRMLNITLFRNETGTAVNVTTGPQ